MLKIKLSPKSSGETEPYGAFVNVDYDNAILECEKITEEKGISVAHIRGSELLTIGVSKDTIRLDGLYMYADFEIVEE